MTRPRLAMFAPELVRPAILDAFRKLSPRDQFANPVMFVVYVGSLLATALWMQALTGRGEAPAAFVGAVALWLWITVLFANFAEALAEGRSKAQAATLRGMRDLSTGGECRPASHRSIYFVLRRWPHARVSWSQCSACDLAGDRTIRPAAKGAAIVEHEIHGLSRRRPFPR